MVLSNTPWQLILFSHVVHLLSDYVPKYGKAMVMQRIENHHRKTFVVEGENHLYNCWKTFWEYSKIYQNSPHLIYHPGKWRHLWMLSSYHSGKLQTIRNNNSKVIEVRCWYIMIMILKHIVLPCLLRWLKLRCAPVVLVGSCVVIACCNGLTRTWL